jgi:hypothetical protein
MQAYKVATGNDAASIKKENVKRRELQKKIERDLVQMYVDNQTD